MHEKLEDVAPVVVNEGTDATCNCTCKPSATDMNPKTVAASATVTSIGVEIDDDSPPGGS